MRMVGCAATPRGFAFAVVENSDRLIDWGSRRAASSLELTKALDLVMKRSRPLFVACEMSRNAKKSTRGRRFNEALQTVCAGHDVMILCVERTRTGTRSRGPTDYELARMVAERFEVLSHRVPKPRMLWQGPDDGMGVFLATAAVVAGWNHFRRTDGVERNYVY